MNSRSTIRRSARPSAFLLALGAAAALAAACGSGSGGSTTPAGGGSAGGGGGGGGGYGGYGAPPPSGGASAAQAASLTTRSTSLGTVLVGPDGRTVYLFEKDTGTKSTCDGACAKAWPPVTSSGSPAAVGGVQSKLLGTTSRADGTTQVTYAGHPLYYFIGDKAPGDVRGEGLKNFGAGWYVLMPNGQKIDKD